MDRVGSSELGAGVGINAVQAGNIIMYGLTNKDVTCLVPLVRSWNYPAPVRNPGKMRSHGYDKTQRAYVFTALSDDMGFTLAGSRSQPIVNSCFVIKNWGSNAAARLKNNKIFATLPAKSVVVLEIE